MKLIGSEIEKNYRSELIRSCQALFSNKAEERFLRSVMQAFPDTKTAFVLDWIPEQGEDIYTVLINDDRVAIFELPRMLAEGSEPRSIQTLNDYRHKLKKHRAIKLAVALDLVSKGYSPLI